MSFTPFVTSAVSSLRELYRAGMSCSAAQVLSIGFEFGEEELPGGTLGAEIETRCLVTGTRTLNLPSVISASAVGVLPSTGVNCTTPSLTGCPSSVTSPRTSPYGGPEQPGGSSTAAMATLAAADRKGRIRTIRRLRWCAGYWRTDEHSVLHPQPRG